MSSEHIALTPDMSDSSESSNLQSLLDEAIAKYKSQEGSSVIEDQLTKFRTCDSIKSVIAILEEQAQDFCTFLGYNRHGKLVKSIKRVVKVLHPNTNLGGAIQIGINVVSVVCFKVLIYPAFLILVL